LRDRAQLDALPSAAARIALGIAARLTAARMAVVRCCGPSFSGEYALSDSNIEVSYRRAPLTGHRQPKGTTPASGLGEQSRPRLSPSASSPILRMVVVGCRGLPGDARIPRNRRTSTHHRCLQTSLPTFEWLLCLGVRARRQRLNVTRRGPPFLGDHTCPHRCRPSWRGFGDREWKMVAPFIADGRPAGSSIKNWSAVLSFSPATRSYYPTGGHHAPSSHVFFWRTTGQLRSISR